MILIVDLDPRLEKHLKGTFPKAKASQAEEVQTRAAGSGVAMARLAAHLNEATSLMTMLGGLTGQAISQDLMDMPIRLVADQVRDESQEALILEEGSRRTQVLTLEPRVTREDMTNFYTLFKEDLGQHDLVVIAPDKREKLPEDMGLGLARLASQAGKPSLVVGTSPEGTQDLIKAQPLALVIDRDILAGLAGRELKYVGDLVRAKKTLVADQVPYLLVRGGGQDALLFSPEGTYHGELGQEDEDLDGDWLVAGLAIGLARTYQAETCLRLSLAAGALGAAKTDEVDFARVKSLMQEIKIRELEDKK